ncbi:MAG: hypothetical protein AAB482_00845 [Patescibacteria group bacterium]
MNQSIVTKIRKGKITLPKGLQEKWGTDEVVFVQSKDGLYIKPVMPATLATLESRLRKLGKLISFGDVRAAIKQARRKTYASRT